MNTKHSVSKFVVFLLVVFLGLSLFIAIKLASERQDIRNRAFVAMQPIAVSMVASTAASVQPGGYVDYQIKLKNVSGAQQSVIAGDVQFTAPTSLTISNLTCPTTGSPFTFQAANNINGTTVELGCSRQGGNSPLIMDANQEVLFGTFRAQVANTVPAGTTIPLVFIQNTVPLPGATTPTNLADTGTGSTVTVLSTATSTPTVTPTPPGSSDLTVENIQVVAQQSGSYGLFVDVRNISTTISSPPASVDVVIDGVLSHSQQQTNTLSPGWASHVYVMPLTSMPCSITATADPGNLISESNEQNNSRTLSFQCINGTLTPTVTPTPTLTTGASCVSQFSGDANGDGKVDMVDYEIWRKQTKGETLNSKTADFNGDGDINSVDYSIWLTSYLAGVIGPTCVPTRVPTATVTPTLTPTRTPTPSPSRTPTPTITPTPANILKPDLTISGPIVVSPNLQGVNQPVNIKFTIINQGQVSTSVLYRYTDQANGFASIATGNTCVGNTILLPGGTCVSSNNYTFSTIGTKTLSIGIDAENQIDESNENNNQFSTTVSIVNPTSTPTLTPTITPTPLPLAQCSQCKYEDNPDLVGACTLTQNQVCSKNGLSCGLVQRSCSQTGYRNNPECYTTGCVSVLNQ